MSGVLCFDCNGGLGQFGDDVDRLVNAIAHLDNASVNGDLVPLARERAAALVAAGRGETAH